MRAAWYEGQGAAAEVLVTGEMPTPIPGPGEVRIHVAASGINPGDVKKRQDAFAVGMPFARVIPHSDGAGVIDAVGAGVDASRVGERAWCFGAQSYRPFGTAAEFVVLPTHQAVPLPANVSLEQGACLGIPGITAHRAVHVRGPVDGRTILVQGGAGAVGQCAVALARYAGARVLATVRSEPDAALARRAGAHHTIRTDGVSPSDILSRIQKHAPEGVDHIVEVAFHANIQLDEVILSSGGSIAAYATADATATIPFWQLVFKNISIYFLGSDDFPTAAKQAAAVALNETLAAGWAGFHIERRFPLEDIAGAHAMVEGDTRGGRVVLAL